MKNSTEIWKRVIEKNIGEYEVSNKGNVRNAITGRVLKPFENTFGYLMVDLSLHGSRKIEGISKRLLLVHRLVAKAFIINPDPINKIQVNHLDENPKNNNADNLSWTTPKENSNYGTRTKRIAEKNQKQVQQIDKKTGDIIYTFGSVKEATEKTGIKSISKAAKGKLKTSGGYLWRYTA
jgi:uncharacterized HNH endonuclease L247|nr:MAG TPA: homing endonuclease [Caudoviricetes sp.]